jgi:hypothetical protein
MKLRTALAAAALCALPVSGALGWGDRLSDNGAFTREHTTTRVESGVIVNDYSLNLPQSLNDTRQQTAMPMGNPSYQVMEAQQALLQEGAEVPLSGRIDPETERTILNYQVSKQLPITGQLDAPTLRSLNLS